MKSKNQLAQKVEIDFKRIIASLLFLVSIGLSAMAQVTDEQLASHYFQSGEFDKAVLYYTKLYNENPSKTHYDFYLKCLYELEDLKGAEKLIKKQQKRFPNLLHYKLDYGSFYKRTGQIKKSDKVFNDVVSDLRPRFQEINNTSRAFQQMGETDYALKTLLKGRKILPAYPFNAEIAKIYGEMNRKEDMIREYLDLIELSANYLQTVQNALQRTIGFEEESETKTLLKNELYARIQKGSTGEIYAELLIWMLIQEKQFEQVFAQVVALDKRNRENGFRLLELAQLASSNRQYDVAIRSLDYVIDKGRSNVLYPVAKKEKLKVSYRQIEENPDRSRAEVQGLIAEYNETLEELGRKSSTLDVQLDLGKVHAYFNKDVDSGIKVLERALESPGGSKERRAQIKLLQADLLLIKGSVWDASLLYMQVEKEFKYDRLGEKAKFKNAKIHYYTADFELAKALLDVLKGSTSKLISNDAMELSLLITDNSTIDTSTTALQIFAEADLLISQLNYQSALVKLEKIESDFPGHALSDEILDRKYKIAYAEGRYENCIQYLEQILESHRTDILADNAAWYLANLYDKRLEDKELAMKYYKLILSDYRDSLFVVESRRRFRELRGDNLN